MKTKCLIVDDEPLAIEVIQSYISKIEGMEVSAKCSSALEAFDLLKKKTFDLIFLDIQMPELSGLDLLKTLSNPPKVIITTAFREYAIDGYEFNVVDYLLKPIRFERFIKAINNYFNSVSLGKANISAENMSDTGFIFVKENRKNIKILVNDILFIESFGDYVVFHLIDKRVTVKTTISSLEESLPENLFLRIHRSFIVSINKIEAFTSSSVEIGKHELTIGRSYQNLVLSKLHSM